jgi:hypothetical protein
LYFGSMVRSSESGLETPRFRAYDPHMGEWQVEIGGSVRMYHDLRINFVGLIPHYLRMLLWLL